MPDLKPKFTKLIDIHDQAERLHRALEEWLKARSIGYRKAHFRSDGFIRYQVQSADFQLAHELIPALVDLARTKPA